MQKEGNDLEFGYDQLEFSVELTYPLGLALALNQRNTMRGCALPLTKFVPPLPHVAIGIKLKPFTFSIASTHSLSSTPKHPLFLSTHHHSKSNAHFSFSVSAQQQQQQQVEADEEENFQVLTALKTDYNDILIVDTPKSRMLLLDSSCTPFSVTMSELCLKIQT